MEIIMSPIKIKEACNICHEDWGSYLKVLGEIDELPELKG
jgi:hypothetical protein